MSVQATQRGGVRARPGRAVRAIVLLREGAFAVSALDGRGAIRPLTSLPHYVEALLGPAQAADASPGGVLGEARSYAQHLQTLQFCLNELIPLLRSSGEASRQCGEGSRTLPIEKFRRLERRALALLPHLHAQRPPLGTPETLARLVGAPCVILGRTVIPLSPVAAAMRPASSVVVGGECYALRSENARPFPELLRDLRRTRERRVLESIGNRPELTRMASEFLGEVRPILEECDPQNRGSYQIFHSDGDHQLQHSRGHWHLVRGPVAIRMRAQSIFVGLHLFGSGRRDWLGVAPRPGAAQGDFWTPSGDPIRRGICVGDPRQYRRLLSSQFSNAEAVVEWLDAGVILITGRSEWHRRLRAGGKEILRDPRIASLQRPRR